MSRPFCCWGNNPILQDTREMDDYGIDGLLDIINPTDAFVEKEGRKERGEESNIMIIMMDAFQQFCDCLISPLSLLSFPVWSSIIIKSTSI